LPCDARRVKKTEYTVGRFNFVIEETSHPRCAADRQSVPDGVEGRQRFPDIHNVDVHTIRIKPTTPTGFRRLGIIFLRAPAAHKIWPT
jgi:hypothetical protein